MTYQKVVKVTMMTSRKRHHMRCCAPRQRLGAERYRYAPCRLGAHAADSDCDWLKQLKVFAAGSFCFGRNKTVLNCYVSVSFRFYFNFISIVWTALLSFCNAMHNGGWSHGLSAGPSKASARGGGGFSLHHNSQQQQHDYAEFPAMILGPVCRPVR